MSLSDEVIENKKANPLECKLIQVLLNVKGIDEKSMYSIFIPNYLEVDKLIENFTNTSNKIRKKICEFLRGYRDTEITKNWTSYDKDHMGTILYYGIIDEAKSTTGKVIFHTFPMQRSEGSFYYKYGQRFDLKMLNENHWFLDEFLPI